MPVVKARRSILALLHHKDWTGDWKAWAHAIDVNSIFLFWSVTCKWRRKASESITLFALMWMNHRGMILVSQAPTLVGKPHINLLLPGPTGMQKATSMKNGGVLPLAACRDRSSASCQCVLIHLTLHYCQKEWGCMHTTLSVDVPCTVQGAMNLKLPPSIAFLNPSMPACSIFISIGSPPSWSCSTVKQWTFSINGLNKLSEEFWTCQT